MSLFSNNTNESINTKSKHYYGYFYEMPPISMHLPICKQRRDYAWRTRNVTTQLGDCLSSLKGLPGGKLCPELECPLLWLWQSDLSSCHVQTRSDGGLTPLVCSTYYYWRSTLAADKEMNRHQCFFLTVCRSPVIAFKRAFDEWTFILSVRCHVAKLHFGTCKLLYFSQCIDKKSPKIAISLSADFIFQNPSLWA